MDQKQDEYVNIISGLTLVRNGRGWTKWHLLRQLIILFRKVTYGSARGLDYSYPDEGQRNGSASLSVGETVWSVSSLHSIDVCVFPGSSFIVSQYIYRRFQPSEFNLGSSEPKTLHRILSNIALWGLKRDHDNTECCIVPPIQVRPASFEQENILLYQRTEKCNGAFFFARACIYVHI